MVDTLPTHGHRAPKNNTNTNTNLRHLNTTHINTNAHPRHHALILITAAAIVTSQRDRSNAIVSDRDSNRRLPSSITIAAGHRRQPTRSISDQRHRKRSRQPSSLANVARHRRPPSSPANAVDLRPTSSQVIATAHVARHCRLPSLSANRPPQPTRSIVRQRVCLQNPLTHCHRNRDRHKTRHCTLASSGYFAYPVQ